MKPNPSLPDPHPSAGMTAASLVRVVRATTMLLALTVLTGVIYPLVVDRIAAIAFPRQATGSVVDVDGRPRESRLLGQGFTSPRYFWSRPSATPGFPYDARSSGGSNLGPSNAKLTDSAKARIDALRAADPGNAALVPVDLVTSSASGLDPHISPAAASYQLARVARSRGVDEASVRALVEAHTEPRTFGVFGEPRVDVVGLNRELDRAHPDF